MIHDRKRKSETDRDFDGNSGIDAMLVIEIDAIDAKPLQAGLAGGPHVGRVPSDLPLPVFQVVCELGGQFHLVPHAPLQRLKINEEEDHDECVEDGARRRR